MTKKTKYGTTISIPADMVEVIKEVKLNDEFIIYRKGSDSTFCQFLIAEGLNSLIGKKTSTNYIKLWNLD